MGLRFSFSTIADSVAPQTGAAVYVLGGEVLFKNSIVAGSGGDGCAEVGGSIVAIGDNLSTDSTCPALLLNGSTADPDLDPLAVVGGGSTTHALRTRTPTHALGWASAAIDAASDCTDFGGVPVDLDQRGELRLATPCDLGAHENIAAVSP